MWEIKQYSTLINKIFKEGHKRPTRAGDAYSIFGEVIDIDVEKEFPLLRGRKMFYKPVLGELAAMLRGPKHIDDFKRFGCNYWDSWGSPGELEDDNIVRGKGELELDYGNAWINFNGVNQLEELVEKLKSNPNDRRLLISGWRPDRIADLSLPCCHMLYQWYVRNGTHLDMVWYQRSCDTMVGLPSDIILAAAWNIILAKQCGYTPGRVKIVLGDTHIYANHVQGALDYMRQLNDIRKVELVEYTIAPEATVTNFVPDMLAIKHYDHQPAIKFELNV